MTFSEGCSAEAESQSARSRNRAERWTSLHNGARSFIPCRGGLRICKNS